MLRESPEPQQPRTVQSRARLLDAAVACLVQHGLTGASTARIAAQAELSQGAIFKHFPTKDALLAAVVERVLRGFVDGFTHDVAPLLLGQPDPVAPVCAALWRIFREPAMRVVFEIYVAAHTDPALTERLAPILERHRAAIFTLARRLFPAQAAASPDDEFEGAVDAIVLSMQGAALGPFAPDQRDNRNHLAFLERLARRELDMPEAPLAPPAPRPRRPSPRPARPRPARRATRR